MREAIRHLEAAMKEMEEQLRIPGDGEHEKDPMYEEMQTKMRDLVLKMNRLVLRMGLEK